MSNTHQIRYTDPNPNNIFPNAIQQHFFALALNVMPTLEYLFAVFLREPSALLVNSIFLVYTIDHFLSTHFFWSLRVGIHWTISLTSVHLGIVGEHDGWISLGFSPPDDNSIGSAKNSLVVVGSPNSTNLTSTGSIDVYKIVNNSLAGMVRVPKNVDPVRNAVVTVTNGTTVLT